MNQTKLKLISFDVFIRDADGIEGVMFEYAVDAQGAINYYEGLGLTVLATKQTNLNEWSWHEAMAEKEEA